uniref:Glutaredoxin domain-containing protein n=1 Tax=Chenopodium quinoa TaxID=63459 RepID=A0A803LWL6_CHEQI
MGCASSKKVDGTTPYIYRPPPSSFAVFDINAIEEPWLKLDNAAQINDQKKSSHVPAHVLEKLDTFEKDASDGPRTWEEKNFSFHTLEELETKKYDDTKQMKAESTQDESSGNNEAKKQLNRLRKSGLTRDESESLEVPVPISSKVGGSLKANPFILRDMLEKEKEGKEAVFDKIMKSKRDPLNDFPEICPPGGAHLVVLYTTSLGGVRRTFEDCNRELVSNGDGAGVPCPVPVPRLFVKGRYLGGAEEVVELNESGRLGRIMSSARVERGLGWQGCEGCGGARFVPCMECGGSCRMIVGDEKERCPKLFYETPLALKSKMRIKLRSPSKRTCCSPPFYGLLIEVRYVLLSDISGFNSYATFDHVFFVALVELIGICTQSE